MASIQDVLSNPVNLPLKYRGRWQPSLGSLPSLSAFQNGSVLIASDSGTISSVLYLQNSVLINAQGSWIVLNNVAPADISDQLIDFINLTSTGGDLDNYDGINSSDEFIYQIVIVPTVAVSNTLNLPIASAGVCEVFGNVNVQKYTTVTGRVFSRLVGTPNQVWTEVGDGILELENTLDILIDAQYNSYSISNIEVSP